MIMADIFIAGASGSGKDTLANYFKSYFNYRKMRLAKTIKQIICEQNDWTFDELEQHKRTNPDIRDLHISTGEWLTKEHSLHRAKQIATRTSMDYELLIGEEIYTNICVCDVRAADEAGILLEEDFIGIFLSRITDEYKTNHWTDNNLFQNGQLIGLINTHPDNCFIVVLNNVNEQDSVFKQKLIDDVNDYQERIDNKTLMIVEFETSPNEFELIEQFAKVTGY